MLLPPMRVARLLGVMCCCPHALLHAETPNLVADILREPEIAIRASRDAPGQASRRELGDSAYFGPGGSTAQAQQADAGNYGGEKGGQVRPPPIAVLNIVHGRLLFLKIRENT